MTMPFFSMQDMGKTILRSGYSLTNPTLIFDPISARSRKGNVQMTVIIILLIALIIIILLASGYITINTAPKV